MNQKLMSLWNSLKKTLNEAVSDMAVVSNVWTAVFMGLGVFMVMQGIHNAEMEETLETVAKAHDEERSNWKQEIYSLRDQVNSLERTIIDQQRRIKPVVPDSVPHNNPGNLVKGNDWQGEVSCEGRFECFEKPEYGIRAMARVLLNYREKHGLTTVPEIIRRWAPPHENDTRAFAKYVQKRLDTYGHNTFNLIEAIILYEQGKQPYSLETIKKGVRMAL